MLILVYVSVECHLGGKTHDICFQHHNVTQKFALVLWALIKCRNIALKFYDEQCFSLTYS